MKKKLFFFSQTKGWYPSVTHYGVVHTCTHKYKHVHTHIHICTHFRTNMAANHLDVSYSDVTEPPVLKFRALQWKANQSCLLFLKWKIPQSKVLQSGRTSHPWTGLKDFGPPWQVSAERSMTSRLLWESDLIHVLLFLCAINTLFTSRLTDTHLFWITYISTRGRVPSTLWSLLFY